MIQRIELTKRFHKIDPMSFEDFMIHEGYKMFEKILALSEEELIENMTEKPHEFFRTYKDEIIF